MHSRSAFQWTRGRNLAAMATNADQIAYWSTETGRKWADDADQMDAMMRSQMEAVLAAAVPSPGKSVLDIAGLGRDHPGAGCGGAHRVGDRHRRLASDAGGRARAGKGARQRPLLFLEGRCVDSRPAGGRRRPDLLEVRRHVLFADPEQAFRNIRRAAKPGARLTFICWRSLHENPFATRPMGIAMRYLPPQPPPDPTAPGPFASPIRSGSAIS